jgi:hypothetical protein
MGGVYTEKTPSSNKHLRNSLRFIVFPLGKCTLTPFADNPAVSTIRTISGAFCRGHHGLGSACNGFKLSFSGLPGGKLVSNPLLSTD